MKKLLLVFCSVLATQVQSQNYCDSVEILIANQSLTSIICSSNTNGLNTFWTSQHWSLTDKYGSVLGTVSGSTATFSMPNPTNSDTNYICLTSILSQPVTTIACNTCDTVVWDGANWVLLSMMMPPPCNLTGGSVYINNSTTPIMMNASVNGNSMYDYFWSNGANSNQTPYYPSWCVSIFDNINGCDTVICENCVAIPCTSPCISPYSPVCGCDGVMYANDCLADCAGVGWTPAIPDTTLLGGFLPCTQPSVCEVEISGDSIICNWASPQVLTAVPTVGTAPYTYFWSNGQSNSPILTIIIPGTYCVTVTDANGCIATECIMVSVQDIPIYSAPSSPIICEGDSIVLEIDTVGLSNITWVPNTLVTPPVHRIVDFPLYPSQTYLVEAIDSGGCDRRGEIFVTVDMCNTSPCIVEINNGTVDIEICDGDTALLEATSGFDTYIWTSTGAPLGSTHIISATVPGIYIVIATDILNNCVDMDSIEVIVYPETPLNPMTVPNPPLVCLGDSVVIEVNPGFLNYWWDTGNPNDTDQDRVVVYPTQDFTYVVEALDANGCESREEIEVFVDTCTTEIMHIMSTKVIIYPNPSKGIMTISLPKGEIFDLVVYDIIGELILSEKKVSQRYVITDNTLANGTYILNLNHANGIITKKIVVE